MPQVLTNTPYRLHQVAELPDGSVVEAPVSLVHLGNDEYALSATLRRGVGTPLAIVPRTAENYDTSSVHPLTLNASQGAQIVHVQTGLKLQLNPRNRVLYLVPLHASSANDPHIQFVSSEDGPLTSEVPVDIVVNGECLAGGDLLSVEQCESIRGYSAWVFKPVGQFEEPLPPPPADEAPTENYCEQVDQYRKAAGKLAHPTSKRSIAFNPPLPKVEGYFGYNGEGMDLIDYIEKKTHLDRYQTDYMRRLPLKKLEASDCTDDFSQRTYPLNLFCECIAEPPEVGLNQAEIVQGENSMRLYSTYTNCVGELDDRFMAAQL